ncbi:MAG: tripartite tricarboxylate transporter TctB family protein [Desulfovibrionaceae bacterium]|nr:tripartite tricarboxylate transporter TctB family protein [Desulfovibrionaceae bacterium]
MQVRIVPYLLLLAGIVLWTQADHVPASPFQIIGAAEYSRGVAVALLLTGGCCALSDLLALLKTRKISRTPTNGGQKSSFIVLSTVILLVAYACGISYLGYAVSTFCFLLLSILIMGAVRRSGITVGLCFTVGTTLLMYWGMRIFNVFLPEALFF